MTKSKLFRNLRPGEQFEVSAGNRVGIVTVKRIGRVFPLVGRKRYVVYGDYPEWWHGRALVVYANERTDLVY